MRVGTSSREWLILIPTAAERWSGAATGRAERPGEVELHDRDRGLAGPIGE